MDAQMIQMMIAGIWETIYMTLVSSVVAYVIGLPLGVILVVTAKEGIKPMPALNSVLGILINLFRSVPFLILMIFIAPLTRLIVGKNIGSTATIVPLVVAAAPYIGRLVESSLKEVDKGVVEAAQSMGATTMQIICKVLIPEAVPSLLTGATIAVTTILGYSAMAGILGGGGLGAIAINYGHYKYEFGVMVVAIVFIIVIVQIFQELGDCMSKAKDRRIS